MSGGRAGDRETRVCEFVFPADTNHLGTLYGGTLLAWMDKTAGVAALRRAGSAAVVTAAVDGLSFRVPIRHGELVELLARVESVGRTSMKVRVEARREDPASGARELCTAGTFTMVAIDDDGRPTPVSPLSPA
jgi:acyl-CoA hydrolase